jgi:hypothetical protein
VKKFFRFCIVCFNLFRHSNPAIEGKSPFRSDQTRLFLKSNSFKTTTTVQKTAHNF